MTQWRKKSKKRIRNRVVEQSGFLGYFTIIVKSILRLIVKYHREIDFTIDLGTKNEKSHPFFIFFPKNPWIRKSGLLHHSIVYSSPAVVEV